MKISEMQNPVTLIAGNPLHILDHSGSSHWRDLNVVNDAQLRQVKSFFALIYFVSVIMRWSSLWEGNLMSLLMLKDTA